MSTNSKKIVLLITFLLCIALAAVALICIGGGRFESDTEDPGPSSDIEKEMNTVYIDGKPYVRRRGVENYLIMGIDKSGDADDAGVGQADFLAVLSFDRLKKTFCVVPVNRDTMVELETYDAFGNSMGKRLSQIALSHAYGSAEEITNAKKCESTASAVAELLCGVKFDGYLSMTMDAVVALVDSVDGVSVVVPEDMTSIDERLVEGESVLMDGSLALKFIRARGSLEDSTNISRMERQELFLRAFFAKLENAEISESDLMDGIEEYGDKMVTNLEMGGLEWLLGMLSDYESTGAVTIPGQSVKGDKYMEFYVDEAGLNKVVTDIFFDEYE